VFCQLETLRRCLPPSIRRTLEELPESLDETYERVLKEIKRPNRDLAHRLLQCLVVAIRPLRVEELAEVLAVDFDDGKGTAKLNPSWRWEDHEQALLSSCSSLISIVENVALGSDVRNDADVESQNDSSLVVQFSHFSVKEFLTSPRLASPSRDVSHYHIILEPAHTTMAQACLGVLLRLGDGVEENGPGNGSPLASYAARHWVAHAQFQNVSSRVQIAMERLFDQDKPHFVAWRRLYDFDGHPHPTLYSSPPFRLFASVISRKSDATPLYYASLCGFQDLAEHLIAKYPHQVETDGGYYRTPALAALARKHFKLARLLHGNGSSVDLPGLGRQTPLYSAAHHGDLEMVQVLLDYKADVNSRNESGSTPLITASWEAHPQTLHVIRVLLENGANPNVWYDDGTTPLYAASSRGGLEVVRLLLKYGAEVEPKNDKGKIPIQIASENGHHEVTKLLFDHGARCT